MSCSDLRGSLTANGENAYSPRSGGLFPRGSSSTSGDRRRAGLLVVSRSRGICHRTNSTLATGGLDGALLGQSLAWDGLMTFIATYAQ
ncbi:MAG: hypothetical protein ACO3FE_19615 [Planctomycetaceae bacterium]